MSPTMRVVLAVGAGAMLGSLARGFIALAVLHLHAPGFPWGTLVVNVAGSFLIGALTPLTAADGRLPLSPARRQFLLTGFCGGFTTCSIFSLETLWLTRQGQIELAVAYVGVSVLAWLAAAWLGFRLVRRN